MTPRAVILAALAAYKREPARANSIVATIVVAIMVRLGLHPDQGHVLDLLGVILPYVAASVATRQMVVPVSTVQQVIRDEVGDR